MTLGGYGRKTILFIKFMASISFPMARFRKTENNEIIRHKPHGAERSGSTSLI